MDVLGLSQVHLVSQSFDGYVALRFSVEYPERVVRLITIGSQPVDQGASQPLPLFSKYSAHISQYC